ncbi:hypothetical protein MTO96_025402 [Rhipicephalus appendiculatus]
MDPSSSKDPPSDNLKKPKHVDKPKPAAQSSVRIRGFSDLARRKRANDDDGQTFYVGGSGRSGQQIIGPGRKADSKGNFVADMFEAAKKHGALAVKPQMNDRTGKSSGAAGSSFSGAGPSTTGLRARMTTQAASSFSSPFDKGQVPAEMLQEAGGAEVDLIMEDHRHEQFFAPDRVKVKPFEGTGHRLAAVTPTRSRPNVTTLLLERAEANAKKAINLNEALPTTNIQIRLSDGSRLVAHMNQTNTVADIRKYIVHARPEYEAATFTLLTTFPRKELTDDKATLKEANLLNAVIVQRLT